MEKILEIKGLVKKFTDNVVLNKLDMNVYKGDVIYIYGSNGCGKSTLLKVIAGLLKADEGTVNINKDIDIGALIENPEFSNYSTIRQNLEYLYNLKHCFDEEKVASLCKMFDLNLYDKKIIKKYSIGMKQKMGIIQAFMENQNLILLDEPTRGLDEKSVQTYVAMMKKLVFDEKTIIVTSHDFLDIGFTKIYALEAGKLYEKEKII